MYVYIIVSFTLIRINLKRFKIIFYLKDLKLNNYWLKYKDS